MEFGSMDSPSLARLEVEHTDDESLTTKLSREAQVLIGGMVGGIEDGAKEAWKDPSNTGLKLAGSVAVGIALAHLQRGAGTGRLAGEAAAAGLSISFLADVVNPGRVSTTWAALRDTWASSKAADHNQAVIKQNLGRFAFDTGLMILGGVSGSLLERGLSAKLPLWEEVVVQPNRSKVGFNNIRNTGRSPLLPEIPSRMQSAATEIIDWDNRINVTRQTDGNLVRQFGRLDKEGRRVATKQLDGTEIIEYWDGARKTKQLDGTAVTEYNSGTRLRRVEQPDGSWTLEYRDGRKVSSSY